MSETGALVSSQLPLLSDAPIEHRKARRSERHARKRPRRSLGLQLVKIAGVTAGTLEAGDPLEPHPNGAGTSGIATPSPETSPCNSGPGLCMVLTCRLNLVAEVDHDTGTIRISQDKGHGIVIPARRTNSEVLKASRIEEAATAVAERAEQLMLRFGSTCCKDVRVKDFTKLAAVMGGTRQRIQQIEASARYHAKAECERRGITWEPTRGDRTTWPEPMK